MGDAKPPGVKHEAVHRDGLAVRLTIDGVAQKGVTEETVVHPDLVGSPGVQSTENQRGAIWRGVKKVKVGNRGFSRTGIANRHALSVHWVARDVVEDGLVGFLRRGLSDAEVEFGALTVGKLGDEMFEGGVCFCRDDAAGGVFVEAVDDAGPPFPAFGGELARAMVEESIDQSFVFIARSGMDDHTGGLIDDDEFRVFVEDREGNVLWLRGAGFFLGDRD